MPQPTNWHQFVAISFQSLIGILCIWAIQTFVVLGVAWIAARVDPSRSAATRCRIWLIAVLACAALVPLSLFFRSLPAPEAAFTPTSIVVATPVVHGPLPVSTPHTSLPSLAVQFALPALWVLGVVFCLSRLTRSLWKLHKIKSAAVPVSAIELGCTSDVATASRSGQTFIALSPQVRSPGLAGLFHPVILMPADIASWTTAEERTAMLRHESVHIERRDHLAGLLVSIVRALLFFHPMVHLACNRISLERELACDEKVLLAAEAKVYAESILKAVERSILPDAVHQAPLFASKKTLERRLEAILNGNRGGQSLKQWRFLLAPAVLIAGVMWLVMPPANGLRSVAADGSASASKHPTPDNQLEATADPRLVRSENSAFGAGQQAIPVIDKDAIWVDTVKHATMRLRAAGLGYLTSVGPGHAEALLIIPRAMSEWVRTGQRVSVEMPNDPPGAPHRERITLGGKVVSFKSHPERGTSAVDVVLEGYVSPSFEPGKTQLEGTIECGQLDNVLYVGRPVHASANAPMEVFKLNPDGKGATKVKVQFGTPSASTVQVLDGLVEGDRIILSDTSAFDAANEITIK
jgi:beta-lactamase regulating signal transducer with metallopeptidase domain